jgi:hypothetical protein
VAATDYPQVFAADKAANEVDAFSAIQPSSASPPFWNGSNLHHAALAEEGYQDLLRTMSRKPYPALDGLRNLQRFTKVQNPQIGKIKVEDLIDSRLIRELDESGFIDGLYRLH